MAGKDLFKIEDGVLVSFEGKHEKIDELDILAEARHSRYKVRNRTGKTPFAFPTDAFVPVSDWSHLATVTRRGRSYFASQGGFFASSRAKADVNSRNSRREKLPEKSLIFKNPFDIFIKHLGA